MQSLSWAHPLIQEWFLEKFKTPTLSQTLGWPSIIGRKSTLICAPTGSGKTFAAFLVCLNALVVKALNGNLAASTEVVYISPLKALSNDIQKNLLKPLEEIKAIALKKNLPFADLRVGVRTGDTLAKDRQAMLKQPPHILVTTPESLYILLTAEKTRLLLKEVKTIIVDEIHALANNKRGTHLSLSLERLEALLSTPPIRIGLSATQKPLSLVGQYLVGSHRALPEIVDINYKRQLDLAVEIPDIELSSIASNEMWDELYKKLAILVQQHNSTLIFTNTRRLAERIAHHLGELIGEEHVASHHGSLSRTLRLEAEHKLKSGELKALVATASLEMGIDIGDIDLVCQMGSPRSITASLQRVGRAGHWHNGISKGRFFATTLEDLVECAALIQAIHAQDLEHLVLPREPLDILTQQIIATIATGDWSERDLYQMVRQAFPYRELSFETFQILLEMLSEGIAGSRGRHGTYLFHDKVNGLLKARRYARLTAIMNGGAIPDSTLFTVYAQPQNTLVGTLDEDFAIESNHGDIILLGTTSWRIIRVEANLARVLVENAHGLPPTVPFWRGEAPGRTEVLSAHVAQLRQNVVNFFPENIRQLDSASDQAKFAIDYLQQKCGLTKFAGQQLINYLLQGRALLGAVPTQSTIIAERFFDEAGGMQLILHAPFGSRINKAWGLSLRKRFCKSFNFELQAAATDNGISIALAEQHSFPLADVFKFLHPNTILKVLTQAVLQSPLFTVRWRWAANRSLALLRFRNGKKIPPPIMRILADDLLAAIFPEAAACQDNLGGKEIELPQHPIIDETMKDIFEEALDLNGLRKILTDIQNGTIKCLACDTPLPSVFSHEILNANPYAFLDDAPLEERRARAVEMRRILPETVLEEIGKLDPGAIQEVQKQAWPDIRSADELHDSLQNFIALPLDCPLLVPLLNSLEDFASTLISQGRLITALARGKNYWIASEKSKSFLTIYPDAQIAKSMQFFEKDKEITTVLQDLAKGWMQHVGPIELATLSEWLAIPITDLEPIFLLLENSGLILRGNFTRANTLEWCERRLLARIHRLTVAQLRKSIAPVSAANFMRWLINWQNYTPNTQLHGQQGLLEIIRKLSGFEIAANAWERDIFSKRLTDYSPDMLDFLCLTGIVGWGRLSHHPNLTEESDNGFKKVQPKSSTPITFFLREEIACFANANLTLTNLSLTAQQVYCYLEDRGASFQEDIVRSTKKLPTEIENGLWELVSVGLITADSFDNLRALINSKRRLQSVRRRSRIYQGGARWSILKSTKENNMRDNVEACCRLLLKRYGIVFRDLITREKNIPNWRDLLITFRKMEDRGEIRGGRFVDGFLGEQFALPIALESLRALKDPIMEEQIIISSLDPLNLVGIILPGNKISSLSSKKIILKNGCFVEDSTPKNVQLT